MEPGSQRINFALREVDENLSLAFAVAALQPTTQRRGHGGRNGQGLIFGPAQCDQRRGQSLLRQMLGTNAVVRQGRGAKGGILSYGALQRLRRNPQPAHAAKFGILRVSGVVTVQVGWGEVLNEVQFDKHRILLDLQ